MHKVLKVLVERRGRKRAAPAPDAPDGGKRPKYVVHTDQDYDYVANRTLSKRTNVIEATAHLVKGCLGGGIMGIHEAYMKGGLWTSLIVTIIFGMYICYCIWILIYSAQILYKRLHVSDMSYPDLAEASMIVGPFPKLRKFCKVFRYAVDFVICIDLFGSCCVYMIIIAKTTKQLVDGHTSEEITAEELPTLRLYLCGLLVPVLLLCMITTLKFLAPFSIVANMFIVVCGFATVYYALKVAPPLSKRPGWKGILGFFEFCGIVVFSMEGIGVSMPIENSMKKPVDFPIVLISGYAIVVFFVMLVGFFGYWGFGEHCVSPVTLNFPAEIFPTILKVMMTVMILVTFAVNFWAPFNLVWHYLAKKHKPEKHWMWERVYRATFVVIITMIAIIFPNIGNLMGLIGSFCLSNMGFIFPALIDTLVTWEHPGQGVLKWRLWKNILIAIAGVCLFSAGTFANLRGLISNM